MPRRRTPARIALFTAGALALAAGCGGKAILDAPDLGGAGSGAGTTGTSSTTVTTSTTTTTTGDLCSPACAAIANCLSEPVASCVTSCQATLATCSSAFADWLNCVSVHPGIQCGYSPSCFGALETWIACQGSCSGPGGSCSVGSDGSCDCKGNLLCNPTHSYEVACQPDPNGAASCSCFADGTLRGSCTDNNGAQSCDLAGTCCAALFFTPGG